ncbi:hypothetical protein B0H63DRAFT_482489 [Podospora didyma]|uniref:Uncharacterized protein n=1 Tax=Podospora didyma TaxID=330526 RepID=A0AAE0KFM2_9PEZI|nr:hypothetical protein B0H63DRAFT_482489 [Podospora didyma]
MDSFHVNTPESQKKVKTHRCLLLLWSAVCLLSCRGGVCYWRIDDSSGRAPLASYLVVRHHDLEKQPPHSWHQSPVSLNLSLGSELSNYIPDISSTQYFLVQPSSSHPPCSWGRGGDRSDEQGALQPPDAGRQAHQCH